MYHSPHLNKKLPPYYFLLSFFEFSYITRYQHDCSIFWKDWRCICCNVHICLMLVFFFIGSDLKLSFCLFFKSIFFSYLWLYGSLVYQYHTVSVLHFYARRHLCLISKPILFFVTTTKRVYWSSKYHASNGPWPNVWIFMVIINSL